MTTYKGIKGFSIQTVDGDPSNNIAGQVWYNSSSRAMKAFKSGSGNFSTGGNTNTRHSAGAGFGIQTAAVTAGGYSPPRTADSEEYNGTAWTEGNNLNTARAAMRGSGTLTAGLTGGGYDGSPAGETEEYDGTSWSEQNDLNTARYNIGTGGIQTAGLCAAGYSPGTSGDAGHAEVEEYDGTSWTEVNNLPSARHGITLTGTQGAMLSHSENTEVLLYDGTNWTEGTNTPESISLGFNAGTQTAAFLWANDDSQTFDGSSWTSVNDMSTNRKEGQAATVGTTTSTLASGGELPSGSPNLSLSTEEWDDPFLETVTFTSS